MVLGLGVCCPCRRFFECLPTGTLDLSPFQFLAWLLNWKVPPWSSLLSQGAQGHGKWKSIWLRNGCQGDFPKEAEIHMQAHIFQSRPPASRAVSCREHAGLSSPAALKGLLYPKCTDVCAMLDLATSLSDFYNSFVLLIYMNHLILL